MMRLALLALALLVTAGPAWAQGAGGERRFNQQLHDVRRQVQPHFRSIRGSFADLRAQGVNTSQWERQLNYAESLLNNMRWQGGGGGKGPGLQTINPFGDYLFHGVPVTPSDGRLVTRHLDPTGLAQRAEEWAKMLRDPYQLIARADEMAGDMRSVTEHLKTRQGAELEKFKKDLNNVLAMAAGISRDELKAADLGGGGRDLKPKALGDDTSDAPRLSGDTPMLLRDPFVDAGRAPGQPEARSVDNVYVPLPPPQISPMDACGGAVGCMAAAAAGEGVQWAQQKYWDARTWANDPMHREWLGDAAMIATAPMMLNDAVALASRAAVGAGGRAAGAMAAEGEGWLGLTFRGDARPPSMIFEEGFSARGTSTDLLAHALNNTRPPSAFVSTSASPDVAAGFGKNVYVVRPVNGINVNDVLGARSPYPWEAEIAVPWQISPRDIRGVTFPDKGYSIFNPNWRP